MAGGSKRGSQTSNTESKSKEESQEVKEVKEETTEVELKPDDDQKSTSSISNEQAKRKGKKPMSPKEKVNQKSPSEAAKKGKSKGIVISEVKEPETETETETVVEKSGMKRKRESVVKSSYSLRSGLKGDGVDVGQQKVGRKSTVRNFKGKKKKEKETEDVVDEEGSCKRQSKRLKRNDDKDKDDGGSGTKRALRARASNK